LSNNYTLADVYAIEVYEERSQELIVQINNTHEPSFSINNLNNNLSYLFVIYAINQLGKSSNVVLTIYNDSVVPNIAKIWSVKGKKTDVLLFCVSKLINFTIN